MIDEKYLSEYKCLIGRMSYYNAAEGSSYRLEREARAAHRKKLQAAGDELILGGLSVEELKTISDSVQGLVSIEDLYSKRKEA